MPSNSSQVYFASVITAKAIRPANLTAKLNHILDNLDLSTIEKNDKVAVKMHLGFNDGYQTVPVLFVRRVVKAIKEQGGCPFITDNPTAVYNAANRGYTQETCGCPIIPVAGVKDGYTKKKKLDFLGIKSLDAAGVLLDADAVVNVTHAKGHGNCGFGGAIKNLALGGFDGPSRWRKMHNVEQAQDYFDKSKMTRAHIEKLHDACPKGSPFWDEKIKGPRLDYYTCDQCHLGDQPCITADAGLTGWTINPDNFYAFQELMAIAAGIILKNFKQPKIFHLNFLLDITPYCDCYGMAMPNVIDDIGIVGGKDIAAVDAATLDLMKKQGLNESIVKKLPEKYVRPNPNLKADLHPFQILHGPYKDPYKVVEFAEKHGLGSSRYTLTEVLPLKETLEMDAPKHQYETEPTFF